MKAALVATLLTLIVLSACMPTPGYAGYVCVPRDAVVQKLQRGYGEVPAAVGKLEGANVIEVFLSPSGTFTVVITRPDGLSCVMATGQNWERLPVKGAET